MSRKAQPPDTLFDIGMGVAINLREISERKTGEGGIIIVMKNGTRYIRKPDQISDWRVNNYLMHPTANIDALW